MKWLFYIQSGGFFFTTPKSLITTLFEFSLSFPAVEWKHELLDLAFDKIEKEGLEWATRRGNEVAR